MSWNHQKLLILCCCIASVCVQSTLCNPLNPTEQRLVGEYTYYLTYSAYHHLGLPSGVINYFKNDWENSWQKTSEVFKWSCTKEFREHFKAGHTQDQGATAAYRALDTHGKIVVQRYKNLIEGRAKCEKMKEKLDRILDSGNLIHFLAYFQTELHSDAMFERVEKKEAAEEFSVPWVLHLILDRYPA